MSCSAAIISLFLLGPCDDAAAGDGSALASALANPVRPAADRARDELRKPGEVLEFLGIHSGMSVLEVFAGGGYYTQILDRAVAPGGSVLAHNNQAYMSYVGAEFDARFEGAGLPSTERVIAEANDLQLQPASLDATLMILAYHDFFFGSEEWGWPDVDETAFLDRLCEAMRPGAVLGIVDHVAAPGGDVSEVAFGLHRIDPARVVADMTGSCFDFTGESELLRNPEDDHATSATEGPFKSHTDRFVYRFVRKDE